jgi:hypothetical protein
MATNARCRLGTSVFFIKYVHFAATQRENSQRPSSAPLSFARSHAPRLLMVSVSLGHTHLFIDRSQPLSLCMRLTIGFNSGGCCCMFACVVQQVNTYDRVPNWFRLSANQLCERRTFQLRDKLRASQGYKFTISRLACA